MIEFSFLLTRDSSDFRARVCLFFFLKKLKIVVTFITCSILSLSHLSQYEFTAPQLNTYPTVCVV